MIPDYVIKEYLGRSLDNHLWIKNLDVDELWCEVNRITTDVYGGMRVHQLACFLLGIAYPQFSFFLDMGTGKTLLSLELINFWWRQKKLDKALIFITSDKAFSTWEDQIHRYGIDVPYLALEGSSTEKWREFDRFKKGLVLLPYPGAVSMCSMEVPVDKANKSHEWVLVRELVDKLAGGVGGFVMDESTKAGIPTSLTHTLMRSLSERIDIRYALAGRPFGRDPTMLWAQQVIVDGGETLGDGLGLFRGSFFSSGKSEWGKGKSARKYEFKKRMMPELRRLIQHRSIAYSSDECIDLPDRTEILEEVQFPAEQEAYYQKAVDTIINSGGNLRLMKNPFMQMRQISSGFMGFVDDDSGERAQIEFDECPKFDRLMELLEEMPLDRKAIVFYAFTFSGRKICKAAEEAGFNPIWLWSGTKDFRSDRDRFINDPNCSLAVVQNQLGAMSLDGLQVANYCMFYESPVSALDREQAERRVLRQGQLRKVFQYDLITMGSADIHILEHHKEADDLFEALRRDPTILRRLV